MSRFATSHTTGPESVATTSTGHDHAWRWWTAVGASLAVGWAAVAAPPVAHAAPVLVADPGWVAYVDANADTVGSTTDANALSLTSPTGSGTLKRIADGSQITGVEVAGATAPTVSKSGSGTGTAAGTDAAAVFGGVVDLAGLLVLEAGGSTTLQFSGLDPGRTYTLVTTANRDRPGFAGVTTTFGLQGAVGWTNESSAGTTASADGAEVTFSTGYNTTAGLVARWTGVDPGPDGQVSLASTFGASVEVTAYAAAAVMLELEPAPDVAAPVITLVGAAVVQVPVGGVFVDPGVVALDDVDGDLSGSVVVGGEVVDTSVVGSYVVTYNVADAAGNPAVEVSRTVQVVLQSLTATPTPQISGDALVGATLTAVPGAWTPAPVDLAFQWYRDDQAIAGATGVSHVVVPADQGHSLAVVVTGSRPGYAAVSKRSADTLPVPGLATLTGTPVPTITGTATVGRTLTAVAGTWTPAPVTLSYRWLRGGVAIPGATAASYQLAAADRGTRIAVQVTGTRVGYTSTTMTSKATAEVAMATLTATPKPTITGTRRVGLTLVAVPGTWGPGTVDLSYQWYRGSSRIRDARDGVYVLVAADRGKRITVKVTGGRAGYLSVTRSSAPTRRIAAGDLAPVSVPAITGVPAVGERLTADPGPWGPDPVKLAYRWLRSGKAIRSATGASYRLTAADKGKRVSVRVTGSKPGYTTRSRTSPATAKVAAGTLDPTPTPVIRFGGNPVGTPVVGQKLQASAGAWGPPPVALAYRWYRTDCGAASPVTRAIGRATRSSYTLVAADVGRCVSVAVTGTKSGYTPVRRMSVLTAAVLPPP